MNEEQILRAVQRMIERRDFYEWYTDEDLYEKYTDEEREGKLKSLLKLQFPKDGNPFSD